MDAVATKNRARDQKRAVMLILIFLCSYFSIAIGIQFAQGVRHGYGTGFANRGHIPENIKEEAGISGEISNVEFAKRTMAEPSHGAWNEIWRICATFAVLLALVFFWHFVISRLGPL